MLHDMFPIKDMASEPMEEVPIVQQPTEGPNEDVLRFINCLKMLINLVMKVVSILANYQLLCICTTWSFLMVGPTNHLPCCYNFCLISFLQMLSCQKIVMKLGRLLRIWAWAIRRFMLVLKIVFYIGRRMPILKLVRTVTIQDGKVMSLKVNKALILPPRKERSEERRVGKECLE